MDLFTIENLSLDEIAVIRQALNVIEIKGSSAQFIANLQNKLDNEINQIKLQWVLMILVYQNYSYQYLKDVHRIMKRAVRLSVLCTTFR